MPSALRGAAPLPVLKPGKPDMNGPDLAGTALLVRERRLILSGRLPLLLGSLATSLNSLLASEFEIEPVAERAFVGDRTGYLAVSGRVRTAG